MICLLTAEGPHLRAEVWDGDNMLPDIVESLLSRFTPSDILHECELICESSYWTIEAVVQVDGHWFEGIYDETFEFSQVQFRSKD